MRQILVSIPRDAQVFARVELPARAVPTTDSPVFTARAQGLHIRQQIAGAASQRAAASSTAGLATLNNPYGWFVHAQSPPTPETPGARAQPAAGGRAPDPRAGRLACGHAGGGLAPRRRDQGRAAAPFPQQAGLARRLERRAVRRVRGALCAHARGRASRPGAACARLRPYRVRRGQRLQPGRDAARDRPAGAEPAALPRALEHADAGAAGRGRRRCARGRPAAAVPSCQRRLLVRADARRLRDRCRAQVAPAGHAAGPVRDGGRMTAAQSYLLLGLAIVMEVAGTTALKASDGFTRLVPSLLTAVAYGASFYLLSLTLRLIPIGVAYAVWSGVGIVLVSSIAWLVYGQRLDLPA